MDKLGVASSFAVKRQSSVMRPSRLMEVRGTSLGRRASCRPPTAPAAPSRGTLEAPEPSQADSPSSWSSSANPTTLDTTLTPPNHYP